MSLLPNSHAKVTGQRSSIEQFLTWFQVEIVANPRNTISTNTITVTTVKYSESWTSSAIVCSSLGHPSLVAPKLKSLDWWMEHNQGLIKCPTNFYNLYLNPTRLSKVYHAYEAWPWYTSPNWEYHIRILFSSNIPMELIDSDIPSFSC